MSLWCGNCRKEIFEGFGILYRLERTAQGTLLLPDKKKDYVPPSSAIRDYCYSRLPESEKSTGEEAKTKAERSKKDVFAFAPANSNNDAFWRSKTWSGIVTDDEKLVFIKPNAVTRFFSKAIEIIDGVKTTAHEGIRQKN